VDVLETKAAASSNFIKNIIIDDLKSGRVSQVVTRFPPEPNGFLHIGHAKAICISFETADEFGGRTHLRFDDTNPVKEDSLFVESIKEDVEWLGFQWEGLYYASEYFEEMYQRAQLLIRKGKAFVCDLSAEQIRATRGSFTEPGKDSPYRNRSVEENLELFAAMREGKFPDGAKVLRAKIDMASPNINLRDPVLYRITHASHHQTGDKWCIYPMYAFAHPLEDAIEGITHSLCSAEFEDQRPLYDWVVRECEMPHQPHQYEFARLNLTHAVTSKRKLKPLVDEQIVDGWDDPRLSTIAGYRRKGYTSESIRAFVREIGVAKSNSTVDARMLEHFVREDLKLKAPRTMAVLRPLKVVITNYPEGQVEMLKAENNSENPEMGEREIPFSREIYIEQDDFMENPPSKYFRLFPGNEVRLKNAYFIKCNDVVKDAAGHVVELHCTYDPETKSGSGFTGRKVKGTIHWTDAGSAVPAEFRLYEALFLDENGSAGTEDEAVEAAAAADAASESAAGVPGAAGEPGEPQRRDQEAAKALKELKAQINPASLEVLHGYVEPQLGNVQPHEKFQFFRHGYFNVDPKYSTAGKPVFNRIVALKSSFDLKQG
jgi:glutaminyl-tRNA synthetase